MRKVLCKKWIPYEEDIEASKKMGMPWPKKGTDCFAKEFTEEVIFLGFGTSSGTTTVLVELPDGTILDYPLHTVKFVK